MYTENEMLKQNKARNKTRKKRDERAGERRNKINKRRTHKVKTKEITKLNKQNVDWV